MVLDYISETVCSRAARKKKSDKSGIEKILEIINFLISKIKNPSLYTLKTVIIPFKSFILSFQKRGGGIKVACKFGSA